MKNRQKGAVLFWVMIFLVVFNATLMLAMTRSQAGQQLAQNRYLDGVALDLAENGLELARSYLETGIEPAKVRTQMGRFMAYRGIALAEITPIGNSEYKVVASGVLKDWDTGRIIRTHRVNAIVRKEGDKTILASFDESLD